MLSMSACEPVAVSNCAGGVGIERLITVGGVVDAVVVRERLRTIGGVGDAGGVA